jgi:hypothetical protein
MQHRSVDDPASHRLQKLGMRNRIEGLYDTLPIISTFLRESRLSALVIHSKVNHSPFLGPSIGMVDCISC